MFAGLIVLAAFIIDLAISTQQNGWHNMYLLFAVTPTGLGAFLLYVGSTIRRQPVLEAIAGAVALLLAAYWVFFFRS